MPRNEYICDCGAVHTEAVKKALSSMPADELIVKVAGFYKIVGDSTRCKILFALQSGELCVCDLANVLSMSKSSVSHQLSRLKESGAVKCRREGKEVYYSLDDEHIFDIFKVSLEHIKHRMEKKDEK